MRLRVVHIHQAGADTAQQIEGNGGTVDELPVTRSRDHTADDKRPLLTGRHARLLQQGVDGTGMRQMKHGRHTALRLPTADEPFIRALAEHQGNAAHDNRLTGACLAGDAQETRAGLPNQFIHQRQVLNFEKCQHIFSLALCRYYGIISAGLETKIQAWR